MVEVALVSITASSIKEPAALMVVLRKVPVNPLAGGLLTGTAALHLARSLINSTVGRLAGCRWACVVCATESGW